jgi:thioredoxin-related protein
MNRHLKICLMLALGLGVTQVAKGQFPWSTSSQSAPKIHKTGSIAWKTDLEEAITLAQKQRKLILIHFSGTHCPPCRKFEDNVLSRNDVAVTLLSRYIPVFVVVEESPELVDRFHVQSWPTDLLIDVEGRELARQTSPQDPREFIKRISMVAAKHHGGQSVTIENVRAAVAGDVMDKNPSVQQTAAADSQAESRTMTQRAETKVVPNPHAKDGRLPPIVARNNTEKRSISTEEEGFSPPNQRRIPPIVRKSLPTDERFATAKRPANRFDESEDDAPAETDRENASLAPWRKGMKPTKRVKEDLDEAPHTHAEKPSETEVASATPQMKREVIQEMEPESVLPPDEEARGDAPDHVKVDSEAENEESVEEGQAAKPSLEESPSLPSRIRSEEVAEETAADKNDGKSEAVAEPEPELESTAPADKTEPTPTTPSVTETAQVQADRQLTKSRFSSQVEMTSPEEEQVAEAPETEQAVDKLAPQAAERADEVQSESSVPGSATSETEKEEAPGQEDARLEQPDAAMTEPAPGKGDQKEQVEPAAKEAVAKQPEGNTQEAVDAPAATSDEVSSPAKDSARPRGLAKIARSGKYVLDGHCCVTLVETKKLAKGSPRFGAIHRGRIYLFVNADARTKFLGNPDDYSPMLSGYDPVLFAEEGQLVEGLASILAELQDGRVVAFSSEDTYKKFETDYLKLRDRSEYVESVRAAMKETNGGRHFR